MDSLFGIPVGPLTTVLVVLLLAAFAVLLVLALRNRVMVRMAVRNIPRRRAQSVLIVVGLMLATLLFSASFATGDTLAESIRTQALTEIGLVDERVFSQDVNESGRSVWFDRQVVDEVREALADAPVDGVAPAGQEQVAAVAEATGRSEPRLRVMGLDPTEMEGFDPLLAPDGRTMDLAALGAGQLYLSEAVAEDLGVGVGERMALFFSETPTSFEVAGIYGSGASPEPSGSAVMRLDEMQQTVGEPGRVRWVLISNEGGLISGAEHTDAVIEALEGVAEERGLEVDEIKRDALEVAAEVGSGFATIFLVFGNFSIIAGVLLIFLIFVMLAAERKQELGITRAVGGQRGHVVRLFAFEGTLYALAAAAVGSVLGVAVGLAVVRVIAAALANIEDLDLTIAFAFRWQSVLLAFALGMTTTLVVVVIASVQVSALNIVRAIRDIPEPPRGRTALRPRLWAPFATLGRGLGELRRLKPRGLRTATLGTVCALLRAVIATIAAGWGAIVIGVLLTLLGASSLQLGLFMIGTSLVVIGVPLAVRHSFRLRDRPAFTIAGLGLVTWWLIPFDLVENAIPGFSSGIEMFIISGVMLVLGAVWTVMYNADVVLGFLLRRFGGGGRLAPVLKTAVAYPLAARFRTGMTLAMFALIVFTLIVLGFLISAFSSAFDDTRRITGGFDVDATVNFQNPIADFRAAIAGAEGLAWDDFETVASIRGLPVKMRQVGLVEEEPDLHDWFVTGVDEVYAGAITYGFQMRAAGYEDDASVWEALRTEPGTVVVSPFLIPSREGFVLEEGDVFKFEGFYLQDDELPDVSLDVFDFAEGRSVRLRVIGVLEEAAFFANTVITTHGNIASLAPTPLPVLRYQIRLDDPAQAVAVAANLEAAFVENGLQAEALEAQVRQQMQVQLTFNRLIQGFMGLGLVVGIAALGVIAARSVVERRQQIGVLRALGYGRGMVQLSFQLESSFIALTGIILGIALGAGLSVGIVRSIGEDIEGMRWIIPWGTIAVVVVVAYGAALLTTTLPARQAANIYPAEALRISE